MQALYTPIRDVQTLPPNSPDLDAAADVLADAFLFGNDGSPDPFYARFHKGTERVHELFRCYLHTVSDIGHTIAVVKDAENNIAGATWIKPPGVRDMSMRDFPSVMMPAIRAFGFIGALVFAWDVIKHIPEYEIHDTYLSMVGVKLQGQGIGRTLVNYAKAIAGDGCVKLSTMNPENIPYYEKLGFAVLREKQTEAEASSYRGRFTTYHLTSARP